MRLSCYRKKERSAVWRGNSTIQSKRLPAYVGSTNELSYYVYSKGHGTLVVTGDQDNSVATHCEQSTNRRKMCLRLLLFDEYVNGSRALLHIINADEYLHLLEANERESEVNEVKF